jgi:hypothetical protein
MIAGSPWVLQGLSGLLLKQKSRDAGVGIGFIQDVAIGAFKCSHASLEKVNVILRQLGRHASHSRVKAFAINNNIYSLFYYLC